MPSRSAPVVVIMGITGSGKSTVGRALADRLAVPFADGDDFHSPQAKARMAGGTPLTDSDRMPWLHRIGAWLARHEAGAVVACSALRRAYRDVLRDSSPTTVFVHLVGDIEIARERVRRRTNHFMPAELVDSQQATLEPLAADEAGITLRFDLPVDDIVDRVSAWLAMQRA
ncbi:MULTISPECIES: gluconokinase [Thermocrispum]|jgi:gluconokinase|uniref:Gluconokinase n=1 Tax=Thermocrispum agreste TaxID=37925 RepID=A0ABD6FJG5_9PSEU|nr:MULTISPECIES: gluconokinase [Thermocrispum]